MKTATIPPLRVEPALRAEIERLLAPGENLSAFVEQALREGVERRATERAFAEKALAARESSRQSGTYHSASSVLRALKVQTKGIKKPR
jgi:Arc/MetJ-type ribon-helix-helix transcriptional regulator